jgi:hypothetical protein
MLQIEERRDLQLPNPEVAVLVEDREELMEMPGLDIAEPEGDKDETEAWVTGALGLRSDARRRRDEDDEDVDEDAESEGVEDDEEYDDDLDEELDDDFDDDDLDDDFDDDFDDDDEA